MVLPQTGQSLSLSMVCNEYGVSSLKSLSKMYNGGGNVIDNLNPMVPSTGRLNLSDFYGKYKATPTILNPSAIKPDSVTINWTGTTGATALNLTLTIDGIAVSLDPSSTSTSYTYGGLTPKINAIEITVRLTVKNVIGADSIVMSSFISVPIGSATIYPSAIKTNQADLNWTYPPATADKVIIKTYTTVIPPVQIGSYGPFISATGTGVTLCNTGVAGTACDYTIQTLYKDVAGPITKGQRFFNLSPTLAGLTIDYDFTSEAAGANTIQKSTWSPGTPTLLTSPNPHVVLDLNQYGQQSYQVVGSSITACTFEALFVITGQLPTGTYPGLLNLGPLYLQIGANDMKPYIWNEYGNPQSVRPSITLIYNTQYHLVISPDGGTYINNVYSKVLGSSPIQIPNNPTLILGRTIYNGGVNPTVPGRISLLRFYPFLLSAADVNILYNNVKNTHNLP
jgi:hypothetical protein